MTANVATQPSLCPLTRRGHFFFFRLFHTQASLFVSLSCSLTLSTPSPFSVQYVMLCLETINGKLAPIALRREPDLIMQQMTADYCGQWVQDNS